MDDQPVIVSTSPIESTRKHRIAAFTIWFLVVFNVLFPKGGFKIGDVPFTWGYLFLGGTLLPLTLVRLAGGSLQVRKNTLFAIATLIPYQFLVAYSFVEFGISGMGFMAAMVVAFYILPFAFLVVYPTFYSRIDGVKLARLVRFCIFGTAVFGIFLFFYYAVFQSLIEIPYLTVNADDYGIIETTKHIARGRVLKLISTYNNGNLYGVAMLILLPLYCRLEAKAWKRATVRIALILTLSRSVWAGLVLEQVLSMVRLAWASVLTFPRVVLGPTLRKALFLLVLVVGILIGSTFVNFQLVSFFLDSGLGGRAEYIPNVLSSITFLPASQANGFLEIIYATALVSYGVLGLICFTLIFLTPAILLLRNPALFQSPLRLAACKGLILYMIVAGADGGILLIPVLAFYWFTYMIFLEGWPGNLEALPADTPPPMTPPSPRRRLRFSFGSSPVHTGPEGAA